MIKQTAIKGKINAFAQKHDTYYKLIKFGFVGGLNTLAGYAFFAFFIFLNLHYSMAALFATVLGVLFNFKTTGVLVFGHRGNSRLLRFTAVYCCTYALNVLALKILNAYNVNMYLAGALTLLPIALISFFALKKFVFFKEDIL